MRQQFSKKEEKTEAFWKDFFFEKAKKFKQKFPKKKSDVRENFTTRQLNLS